MADPDLPRDHAHPADVRMAAWRHAHRAHELADEADAFHLAAHDRHDPSAAEPTRLMAERCGRRAAQHAQVALALMATGGGGAPR
jgi:hypothetical protein